MARTGQARWRELSTAARPSAAIGRMPRDLGGRRSRLGRKVRRVGHRSGVDELANVRATPSPQDAPCEATAGARRLCRYEEEKSRSTSSDVKRKGDLHVRRDEAVSGY